MSTRPQMPTSSLVQRPTRPIWQRQRKHEVSNQTNGVPYPCDDVNHIQDLD